MKTTKKKARRSSTDTTKTRMETIAAMHATLLQEHQIACGYLSHLSHQPDVAELEPAAQRSLIQAGLEKYATVAQKLLSILEKLTEHEQKLSALDEENGADEAADHAPTDVQWDMLIRHAHRQLKQPILPRVPLPTRPKDEDISKS